MVRLRPDLSLLPETVEVIDVGIMGNPGIRNAVIVVLLLMALGVGLFFLDHILTRNPEEAALELVDPEGVDVFSSSRFGTVVGQVTMFSGPGEGYTKLCQLEPGSQVQVLGSWQGESGGGWIIVQQYGNPVSGWIRKTSLEPER